MQCFRSLPAPARGPSASSLGSRRSLPSDSIERMNSSDSRPYWHTIRFTGNPPPG